METDDPSISMHISNTVYEIYSQIFIGRYIFSKKLA